jgi:predicted nucleic acid-binding protein
MPIAVSNSSPLIHLAAIGSLWLVREFFDEIRIPPAVWREVVEEGRGRPGAAEVALAAQQGWLRVVPLHDEALAKALRHTLDDGEAETLALAVQEKPDWVLLDELEARRAAEVHGLAKTGVIGLLMRAKQQGKVVCLKDLLDRLRTDAGFWIADQLYQAALAAAGETPIERG